MFGNPSDSTGVAGALKQPDYSSSVALQNQIAAQLKQNLGNTDEDQRRAPVPGWWLVLPRSVVQIQRDRFNCEVSQVLFRIVNKPFTAAENRLLLPSIAGQAV